MEFKNFIFLTILLLFLSGCVSQTFPSKVFVKKVVDGDTFVASGYKIRLIGIDAPEKGQPCYEEARLFLKKLIENKTVRLEYDKVKKDKYGRLLAYVWINNTFVNREMVINGFAVYRNYGEKLIYENLLNLSPRGCVKEIDTCEECIGIAYFQFNPKGDDCKGGEFIKLKNYCSFPCNLTKWRIEDSQGNRFVLPQVLINTTLTIYFDCEKSKEGLHLCKKGCKAVWDNKGDVFKLYNSKGKLVIYYRYP